MAQCLLENNGIKGILIGNKKETLSQYANDMSVDLFTLYNVDSVEQIISELRHFCESTGLKVNFEKSAIHLIGAAKNCRHCLYFSEKFKWSSSTINTLGIVINLHDVQDTKEVNVTSLLERVASVLKL